MTAGVHGIEDLLALHRLRQQLPAPPLRRMLRERAGLSQKEIAGVVGVDRATVCRWEQGIRHPSGRVLAAYIAVLDRLAAER